MSDSGRVGTAWRAFNAENVQLRYGGQQQGKCIVCGADVAWLRPRGTAEWLGVVTMADVTDYGVEQLVSKTGAVAMRIVAYNVKPEAILHACKPINQQYAHRFNAFKMGVPLQPRPAGTIIRRRRRSNAPPVPAPVTMSASVPIATSVPNAQPVPNVPVAAPATATNKPDPQIPPDALKQWQRAQIAVERTSLFRILLYGPPGTGKTSFPNRLATAKGWSCFNSLPLTEETPASALMGQFILKGGSVEWLDGIAVRAARESHVRPTFLVLNEISHASSDAMTMLHAILDDRELVKFYLPTGECVEPKGENWRVIATSNDEPDSLPEPVRSRFEASILISHPHPGILASCYSREAKLMLASASREYDIRHILAWDRLMREGFSLKDAAYIVFNPAAAQSLVDAARLAVNT